MTDQPAQPTDARGGVASPFRPVGPHLEEIHATLSALVDTVEAMQQNLRSLSAEVGGVRGQLDQVVATATVPQGLHAPVDLTPIENRLDVLSEDLSTIRRTSMLHSPASPGVDPAAIEGLREALGRIDRNLAEATIARGDVEAAVLAQGDHLSELAKSLRRVERKLSDQGTSGVGQVIDDPLVAAAAARAARRSARRTSRGTDAVADGLDIAEPGGE